jgi:hypothetical protein
MAEGFIILLAIATVVGVFFLVLFSILSRREHCLNAKKAYQPRKSPPRMPSVSQPERTTKL